MDRLEYHDKVLNEITSHRMKQFFKPHHSKYSLPNITSTILDHFHSRSRAPIDDEPVREVMEGCETVILLLVDGLGYNLLNRSKRNNNLLDRMIEESLMIPITSTFPSTTTTALTSLNTGLTPQEHGIVGHTMYLKKYGTIANMIKFSPVIERASDALVRAGLVPEEYLGKPTMYESLSKDDVNSVVLTKWTYRRSMLSRMLHKGATVVPYVSSPDLFVSLAREVKNHVPMIFAYWDSLDTASHAYGPDTEEVQAEFRNLLFSFFNEFINRLDRKTAKSTCVLITGDHGLVQVDPSRAIIANEHPSLMKSLERPPTGDSRASFLKVTDGKKEAVERFFKKFSGRIDLFETEHLLAEGFFGQGEMKDGVREAIGDMIALSRKGNTFRYRFRGAGDDTVLRGHHGGLTDEELFVPLICLRPSELNPI